MARLIVTPQKSAAEEGKHVQHFERDPEETRSMYSSGTGFHVAEDSAARDSAPDIPVRRACARYSRNSGYDKFNDRSPWTGCDPA